MKKALIITYYWPPSGGAGVQRWLKFVKYMRDFGWEPVVYTALDGEMPVVDQSLEKDIPQGITVLKRKIFEPYTFYKLLSGRKKSDRINPSFLSENKKPGIMEKISVWLRGNFFIPDARCFWIKPSIRFLDTWLKKNKVDAIISSGPPHSMHLIAMGLKKRHPKIKWLADFRDPWTQIDFYHHLMLTSWADKKHRRLEQQVLRNADHVVAIGKGMAEGLARVVEDRSNRFTDKLTVITNGFDEADLVGSYPAASEKFIVAHIGTLVKDRNSPELWNVLSNLVKTDPDFRNQLEIKLIGKTDISVRESIAALKLTEYTHFIPYLPHADVIAEQQRASALLLLVNRTPNSKAILTGKFFEYLASGRPVLAIGPADGDLAQILRETNAGLISDFNDEAKLTENIISLFKGDHHAASHTAIQQYSRRALTRKLCALLDTIVSAPVTEAR